MTALSRQPEAGITAPQGHTMTAQGAALGQGTNRQPEPRRGALRVSIPNVALVVLDPVSAKELAVLVLEGVLAMVLLLAFDVPLDGHEL